jgi:hypothetical protein
VRGSASALENRLLAYYLRIGYRPALVIFFDGINETCKIEMIGNDIDDVLARAQDGYAWQFGAPVLHVYARISASLRRRMGSEVSAHDRPELDCEGAGRRTALRTLHSRTMAERDALCRLYEVDCRTVVQPFAGVHGRNDDVAVEDRESMRSLFDHLQPSWRESGALFVTDALDGYARHAFVDEAHYNRDASRLIAEAIAARLALR